VPNELAKVLALLEPFRDDLVSVAVESTFNWYWLVDGLRDAGFDVKLVNTAAIVQYEGLKYSGDVKWTHQSRHFAG
jgi:transposase